MFKLADDEVPDIGCIRVKHDMNPEKETMKKCHNYMSNKTNEARTYLNFRGRGEEVKNKAKSQAQHSPKAQTQHS